MLGHSLMYFVKFSDALRGKCRRLGRTTTDSEDALTRRSPGYGSTALGRLIASFQDDTAGVHCWPLQISISARGRRRFFRSTDRRATDPTTARVSIGHSCGAARIADGGGKLLAGEILIANPSSDHRQTHDYARAADRIFFHGKQLDGARGLRCSASSFRPSAASIKPSTHRAPASSGRARTSFSCSARAAVKVARALASSFVIRAIRPSTKRGLYFTTSLPTLSSPSAAKALAAAAGSRSASAQVSQVSATLWIAPGSFARSSSIN